MQSNGKIFFASFMTLIAAGMGFAVRGDCDLVGEDQFRADELRHVHELAVVELLDHEFDFRTALRFEDPGRSGRERAVEADPFGVGVPFGPGLHVGPAGEELQIGRAHV